MKRFSSLRSRLWLSYALLIFVALGVVMSVLLIYLIRNPLLYRETLSKLRAVETVVIERQGDLSGLASRELHTAMQRADENFDVRLILFTGNRQVVYDTRAVEAEIALPVLPALRATPTVRDSDGGLWLYSIARLSNNQRLMITMPRPHVSLLAVLGDELMSAFWGGGAIALLLSLLLALGMARWIADPLQRIIFAAREIPAPVTDVPVNGPQEVKDLAQAFNEMVVRLQDTQQSQREFVANVSHELKTPLTSIQGFAQALLEGAAETPESRQQAAQIIYDEAGRMHRMALDLLDLARLDAGIAEMKMGQVDLSALLQNIIEKFSPQAQQEKVKFVLRLDSLPEIVGDGDRLSQVFTNLIDNALKYTPAEREISIEAVQKNNTVEISVCDTGAGISEEALPHIFERFYQADPSRSRSSKHSSGLGLAIVREIVQAHGGKITVRSEVNEGTTFLLSLPIAQADATTIISRRK